MGKLIIVLLLAGLAYEYALTMQRCINQEKRMQSSGGLGGLADVGSSAAEAETVCAAKHNLYQRDGKWYRRND